MFCSCSAPTRTANRRRVEMAPTDKKLKLMTWLSWISSLKLGYRAILPPTLLTPHPIITAIVMVANVMLVLTALIGIMAAGGEKSRSVQRLYQSSIASAGMLWFMLWKYQALEHIAIAVHRVLFDMFF